MYLVKTPRIIQKIFSDLTWMIPSNEKTLYLTFDDGPIPEVTPWVLETLKKYRAQATFFCVGDNVKKYPSIYSQVIIDGHAVGNHTFNHLSGWNTNNTPYIDNIEQCAALVNSNLFRPPYGRITRSQAQALREEKDYNIIMWDVLSGDFDPNLSNSKCLNNVIDNTRNGSIIVFHDSLKAEYKLRYVLPKVLDYFSRRGYSFEKLQANVQYEAA